MRRHLLNIVAGGTIAVAARHALGQVIPTHYVGVENRRVSSITPPENSMILGELRSCGYDSGVSLEELLAKIRPILESYPSGAQDSPDQDQITME